ncbi:MAG: aldo/keto reductase [Candidatus Glassbacteria bacterium]
MNGKDSVKRVIGRREFIAGGIAAAVGAGLPGGSVRGNESGFPPFPAAGLPSRQFGKTGSRITLLTFGGGPWGYFEESTALKLLTQALDSGINCIDTAYGYGRSEEFIGRLIPARRKEVLIHTKIATRDRKQWWQHLETSLKRLNVSYVDSLMIHHLEGWDDLEKLEGKGGPFDLMQQAKEQKLARWTGVSAHTDSRVLLEAVRRHGFDHVMLPLNVATNGFADLGFEEIVLPELARRGVAVTAMKALGTGNIVKQFPAFDYITCLRYTLSLPSVATATVTMPNLQNLLDNVEAVRNFQPFTPTEMAELKRKAEGELKTSFRSFMQKHLDVG